MEELISDHLLTVFKAESKCDVIHILNALSFMNRLFGGGRKDFCILKITTKSGLLAWQLPTRRHGHG